MKLYGQILIFILLFITNARILFVKHAKKDSIVMLAPVSFLLSILQIFSMGITVFTVFALIVSIFVLLSNFHALFRYSERLFIDHYSPLMKVWSIFTMILSGAGLAACIYFFPFQTKSEKLDVSEIKLEYEGSVNGGFEQADYFSKINATLYDFTLVPQLTERDDVILFIPDKRGDTENYRPYLQLLAKQGYTVYSFDIFASDLKWFYTPEDSKLLRRSAMVFHSLWNNQKFMAQKEFYTYNTMQEIQAVMTLLDERCGKKCRYFLISDVMANTTVSDLQKMNPQKISGFFCLDSVSAYKTPGYGCIEHTDPLLALILGQKRDFDKTSTIQMVEETARTINAAWGIGTKPEQEEQNTQETQQ